MYSDIEHHWPIWESRFLDIVTSWNMWAGQQRVKYGKAAEWLL